MKSTEIEGITVLLFGPLQEELGISKITILDNHIRSVSDLRNYMIKNYPNSIFIEKSMVAIDHKYASEETILSSRNEIALIPPVSGG